MLNEHKAGKHGYEYFLKAALIQLLILAARHVGRDAAAAQANLTDTHKTVSNAAAYINNNYAQELTLESVAKQFAVSPCYLSRIFKRITGIPFTDYLNGVRIKESEQLIRRGRLYMSEIAFAAGFRSATQFGRVFKKTVGVSPSEYKRQNKNRQADK